MTQTLAVGDARIIDEPTPGLRPVAPKKAQIALIAFVLAMLIPAAIIYIKGLIFPSFHDKVELEKLTQIPVLSEIPNCDKDKFFVVKEKSNNTASELFRLLRNNLQFTLTSPDKKVIMVFNKIDAYNYIEKEEDDLTPITKRNYTLEDWKKTWMAKGNNCIFISAVEKDNYQEFRDLLYQEIRDMHAIRYPYDNFLY